MNFESSDNRWAKATIPSQNVQIISGLLFLVVVVGSWLARMVGFGGMATISVFVVPLLFVGAYITLRQMTWTRVEAGFLFYSLALALALALMALWSIDPVHSVPRAVVSSILLGLSFLALHRFARLVLMDARLLHALVNYGLAVFLAFLLLGYILFPEFRGGGMGGLRLTGNVNANAAGLYSFTFLVWVAISRSRIPEVSPGSLLLLVLALVVLFLSFSRASWLAAGLFYLFLFSFRLRGANLLVIKKSSFASAGFLVVLAFAFLAYYQGMGPAGTGLYMAYLDQRVLSGILEDGNFQSRLVAWKIMWDGFLSSPAVGYFGWYGASQALSESAELAGVGASSPHSFHLRILSEVGLFGYILIMGAPIVAVFYAAGAAEKGRRKRFVREGRGRETKWVVVAGLLALFLGREVFEDAYMTGFLSYTTLFAVFLMACAFALGGYRSLSKE